MQGCGVDRVFIAPFNITGFTCIDNFWIGNREKRPGIGNRNRESGTGTGNREQETGPGIGNRKLNLESVPGNGTVNRDRDSRI